MKPASYRERLRLTPLLVFLISGMTWIFQHSCQRIEFEPEELLFITTDSINFTQTEEETTYLLQGSVLYMGGEKITDHGFCWSDTGSATLEGAAIHLGARESTGAFSAELTGLETRTLYFVRAFAVSGSGVVYGNEKYIRTPPRYVNPTVTDIDGNTYNVVIVGAQAWMVENLRTTRYADGTPIPKVQSDSAWEALDLSDKAYSWFDNDSSYAGYGAYYTWAAAMNGEASSEENPSGVQGVCPEEWHIPSDAEWNQFHVQLGTSATEAENIGSIGSRDRVGTKMKGIGDPLWAEDLGYWWTNQSGFTALPVGQRTGSGEFQNMTSSAYFWSSTRFDESSIWYRNLQRRQSSVNRVYGPGDVGYSVRCVIDL